MVLVIIGPRQMTGWSSVSSNPMLITFTPCGTGGTRRSLRADGRFLVNAHHQRNAWPVNVAIQQTDFRAEMLQRAGEIRGTGGFADAAFAAGDGDDAFTPGILFWPRAPAPVSAGGGLPHFDVNVVHAGKAFSRHVRPRCFDLLRGVGIRRGQLHRHAHRALAAEISLTRPKKRVARKAGILTAFSAFWMLSCESMIQ